MTIHVLRGQLLIIAGSLNTMRQCLYGSAADPAYYILCDGPTAGPHKATKYKLRMWLPNLLVQPTAAECGCAAQQHASRCGIQHNLIALPSSVVSGCQPGTMAQSAQAAMLSQHKLHVALPTLPGPPTATPFLYCAFSCASTDVTPSAVTLKVEPVLLIVSSPSATKFDCR